MKQKIRTRNAPAPIGPYNQAIKAGNTLYVSGQIAINPHTGVFENQNIQMETTRVLENLEAVVKAGGCRLEDVVKCSIFLSDMNNFAAVNEIYAQYFDGANAPARETVEVSALPKGANVEISCIAVAKD